MFALKKPGDKRRESARVLLDLANNVEMVHALLNRLAANGRRVRVVYTSGNWLDVDSLEDVVNAAGF